MIRIKKQKKHTRHNLSLVTQQRPRSLSAEAYRGLRANLSFAAVEGEFRTVLVTSPETEDGKSTVLANLAVVMAQAGSKVIVVDCDLHRPNQHNIFAISNSKGFTTCIAQQMPVSDIAHISMDGKLTILTSGPLPPNPTELLNSTRCRQLWSSLQESYDYILVDSPPLLAVSDTAVLSAQVDGVILVLRAGSTRFEIACQAKEQLNRANARLLGVVLNQAKRENKLYYYQ